MPGLFAFFKRTLREHSRSGALVMTRTALAVTLLFCLAIFSLWANTIGAAGLEFFHTVIFVNAVFIIGGGCTYFASAIAEEKEDGTLALLRISRVSSLAVLLGKGGSRMLDGLLLLAVQIPFTLIGVTLGGITWTQVLAAYASLAVYLTFICAVGLLAGVLAGRTMQAIALSVSAIAVLFFAGALNQFGTRNIFGQLSIITSTNFDGPVLGPWCTSHLLAALGLFLAAWVLFDRFCSEAFAAGLASSARPLRQRIEILRAPVGDVIRWKDLQFLHTNPAARYRKVRIYIGVALLLSVDLLLHRHYLGHGWAWFMMNWGLRILGASLFSIYVEWLLATSRAFSEEQRDHTLASLMILPGQTAGTLLHSKLRLIPALLREAIIFVWAGLAITMLGVVGEAGSGGAAALFMGPIIISIAVPLLWSQGICLQRLVLHLSLRVRTGALPLAIGIWILGNLLLWLILMLLGSALFLFGSLVGIFALIVPAAIAASVLREKNLLLIEQAAEGN